MPISGFKLKLFFLYQQNSRPRRFEKKQEKTLSKVDISGKIVFFSGLKIKVNNCNHFYLSYVYNT